MSDRRTAKTLLLMTNSVAIGGMEEHVRLIAKHVDRSRFRVVGIAPDWPQIESWSRSLASEVDVFEICTPDARSGRKRQLREIARIWQIARRNRVDLAHLHSTSYRGLTTPIVALRLAGVRRIFMTEHLPPETPPPLPKRLLRRVVSRVITGLVCVSENNRDARERFIGIPKGRTHVVNNGIDIDRFAEPIAAPVLDELRAGLGIDPATVVVGTAIRFEPDKGVDDLVRAFAIARATHPNVVLLLVGDGSTRDALEAQVRDAGLEASVVFTGFQTDPRPYIELMDVFVLPVPYGSASIALLEAMAMRRSCIITFGGDKEAVTHGECGFCARPHDAPSLAHHISLLVGDAALRSTFGERARRRVAADYSAERVARELEALYSGDHGSGATS